MPFATMKNPTRCAAQLGLALLLTLAPACPSAHAEGKVAVWGDSSWQQTRLPNGLDDVKAIAAGWRHSLALKRDGTVITWGYDASRVPADLSNVVAIAAGAPQSLALKADGTVVTWGGAGTVPPVSSLSNVTAIAAGWYHWVALKSDGTIATASVSGAADSPANSTNIPPGLSNIVAVAAGVEYTLVLSSAGTVTAWGRNSSGLTNVPTGLSNVVAIAAGYYHSLALKADGTVISWGAVGNPAVPVGLSNVVAIAAGERYSLALRADGAVVAWWAFPSGLPDLGQTTIPPGLSDVRAIAAGRLHCLALVSDGPPEIHHCPSALKAEPHTSVTFSAAATGAAPLFYRWLGNGQALTDSARISGATSPSLTISDVQFGDAGTYALVASNALGWVVSENGTLKVIGPPRILQQSPNQAVVVGAGVTLSVAVEGTPALAYQWSFQGANLRGSTTSSLFLPNVPPKASGDYTVVVSNGIGTTSATIGLLVTNGPPVVPFQPSLTTTNLRTTVMSPIMTGSSVAISVSAIGTPPFSYQWQFDGVALPGATNQVLVLENLTAAQAGFYRAEVGNAFGATYSANVLLNVSSLALLGAPVAGNTNMPLGLSGVTAVAAGGSHLMALLADGTVRTWLVNSGYLYGLAFAVTNVPARATNVVAIAAGWDHCLALRGDGTVVAWGGPGSHTNVPPGLVDVVSIAAGQSSSYAVRADGAVTNWGGLPLSLWAGSNVVAVAPGAGSCAGLRRDGTVAFRRTDGTNLIVPGLSNAIALAANATSCQALRADGNVVRWSASGTTQPALVLDGNRPISNAVAIAVGASQAWLTLMANGSVVASGLQAATSNNIIAIAAGGVGPDFGALLVGDGWPAFTLQPLSQRATKGSAVTLHARAVGAPPLNFQWQHTGADLPGATAASLAVSNFLSGDRGAYRVVVSNPLGTVTSRVAALNFLFPTNVAGALETTNVVWSSYSTGGQTTNGWLSQSGETHDGDAAAQSAAIAHGQQSVLQATVIGPVALSFWWNVSSEAGQDFLRFYDGFGTPLASLSGESGWQSFATNLSAGSHTLRWVYSKDGSGSAGRDAGWLDEVRLTPRLEFNKHPRSHVLPVGTTVTLAAGADCVLPVSYQWLKNGVEVPGATGYYLMLTRMGRRDSATYAMRATCAVAVTTSSNAVVKVLVPQRFLRAGRLPDGTFEAWSRDVDGGLLAADDLPGFQAQASANAVDWSPLAGALSVTNGWLWLRDTNAADQPTRFYRILEP